MRLIGIRLLITFYKINNKNTFFSKDDQHFRSRKKLSLGTRDIKYFLSASEPKRNISKRRARDHYTVCNINVKKRRPAKEEHFKT